MDKPPDQCQRVASFIIPLPLCRTKPVMSPSDNLPTFDFARLYRVAPPECCRNSCERRFPSQGSERETLVLDAVPFHHQTQINTTPASPEMIDPTLPQPLSLPIFCVLIFEDSGCRGFCYSLTRLTLSHGHSYSVPG